MQEVKQKFKLAPVDVHSTSAIAAALDSWARGLSFLDEDQRQDLRQEILRRCLLAAPDTELDGEVLDGDAVEPPAKSPPIDLDMFFGEADDAQVSASAQAEQDGSMFFGEKAAPSSTDPLNWWHTHGSRFALLSQVARQLLCVPATSVPSERVFSAAGHIVSKLRAALSADNIDALIFLQQKRALRSSQSPVPRCVPDHPKPLTDLSEVLQQEVDDALPPLPNLD